MWIAEHLLAQVLLHDRAANSCTEILGFRDQKAEYTMAPERFHKVSARMLEDNLSSLFTGAGF